MYQTFGLTLNLTLADFCLLGFLTMRSVMPRDFVQGRRCRWTKLPLRRISDARLPVSNGNCLPCKDFFQIKLSGQTYFRHHPCSFIRIDRMSVINRNWRFTPIAGSEFRSILRHSHSLPPPTRSSGRARRGHPCAGDVDQSELSKCPRTTGDQVIKHSVYFIRKN